MSNYGAIGTSSNAGRSLRRERHVLVAAALATGPVELLDFLLPLWAGVSLGASPLQTAALAALEMVVSLLVRPLAGILADARERRYVAAVGALLYGLSCVGYASATALSAAYAAAVLGGIGGALLWVSVRAMVSERLSEDSGVFARLMSAQETGSWVGFVVGLSLVAAFDAFHAVFAACAVACLLAALALVTGPRRAIQDGAPVFGGGLRQVGRTLRPVLLAVVLTMAAEAAVGMLLLLHLQRGFELDVIEIAYVFLPGAIAMSVLPGLLHRFVLRFGRARILAAASVSSAVFATGLAWAPNPVVIAALWVFSGVAWAAVIPIQQAVIAEASGGSAGRGMGLYGSATLLGGVAGVLAAGALYEGSSWTVACLLAAAIIGAGAVLVPRAVRAAGVADIPLQAPAPLAEGPSPRPEPLRPDEPVTAPAVVEPVAAVGPVTPVDEVSPVRRRIRELAEHALLYAAVQVVLAFLDRSWLVDLVTSGHASRGGDFRWLYDAGRIWTFVLLADAIWTVATVIRVRRAASQASSDETGRGSRLGSGR